MPTATYLRLLRHLSQFDLHPPPRPVRFALVCSLHPGKLLCMPAIQDRAPSGVLHRKRIGIALVACVAVGIVCFFTLRSSEPEHGGKPLSRWVEQLFKNYPRVDAEARDALKAMGLPAVRFLTGIVDHEPSAWRL